MILSRETYENLELPAPYSLWPDNLVTAFFNSRCTRKKQNIDCTVTWRASWSGGLIARQVASAVAVAAALSGLMCHLEGGAAATRGRHRSRDSGLRWGGGISRPGGGGRNTSTPPRSRLPLSLNSQRTWHCAVRCDSAKAEQTPPGVDVLSVCRTFVNSVDVRYVSEFDIITSRWCHSDQCLSAVFHIYRISFAIFQQYNNIPLNPTRATRTKPLTTKGRAACKCYASLRTRGGGVLAARWPPVALLWPMGSRLLGERAGGFQTPLYTGEGTRSTPPGRVGGRRLCAAGRRPTAALHGLPAPTSTLPSPFPVTPGLIGRLSPSPPPPLPPPPPSPPPLPARLCQPAPLLACSCPSTSAPSCSPPRFP